VSLVFFCGRHTKRRDADAGGEPWSKLHRAAPERVIRISRSQSEVDLEGVRVADVVILCALFEWLVWWLPKKKTLVCVVDGVRMYERPSMRRTCGPL